MENETRDAVHTAMVSAIRSACHLDVLKDVETPEGFLRHLEATGIEQSNDFKRLLDFALTLILCQHHERAKELLRRLIDHEDPNAWYAGLRLDVAEILHALTNRSGADLEKIALWEHACRANLLGSCMPA